MSGLEGRNLAKVKKQNMAAVKTILYRQAPLSRVEIAEQLELTPPTITNIVSELIQAGVVQELTASDLPNRGIGRKPINIDLIPQAKLALGISLGRDRTRYCVTDLRGSFLLKGETELVAENYEIMLQNLLNWLDQFKKKHTKEWQRLLGIGISMPGIVDTHAGVLKSLDNERISWRDQPLAESISRWTGLPVVLENNVRARTSAISLFHPKLVGDSLTFAFCHISWGIACPVVLDNRNFRGEDAAAGEIGKMILDPQAAFAGKHGRPGTLETLSGVSAILERCREALERGESPYLAKLCSVPQELTLDQVLEAQRQGDPVVCRILEQAMLFLGIALANIVDFLNPHLIFLSSALFKNSENFALVEKSLYQYVFRSGAEELKLVPVDLGEYGGAAGAAARCIDRYFVREL
ncbi:hypothetical protein C3V36_05630 [Lachnospiraceae bacterium oral taxon 500]|nr:hypothetical protein C3V36_05630 [Lachnospiraceae bacterium oral taxon 500]